ncbi:LamG domain-containing protein [Algibacter luteus]|uniref:Por secretion system C-terminal sorting domain-containing protein n=1 Tax=Algibacter luteus TaxID=1178825 RepID=A0A1M6B2A6_9FLAO|nr:LamG domain-containing protein [Algibacter luteus]SHI42836.1 Por secretion system C-terminal sorting domain-containing protein [Algibacter luteus]
MDLIEIKIQIKTIFAKIKAIQFKTKICLFFSLFIFCFNTVSGQIEVDNTATGSTNNSQNLTINHSVSPGLSNSVMVVSFLITSPLSNLNTLTYGGENLTLVESSNRNSISIAVYTLVNPPVGTNAISISTYNKTDITLAGTSFGNVNQDNVFSLVQKNHGNSKEVFKSIDCDEGSFAIDFLGIEGKSGTEDAGQTLLFGKQNNNGKDYLYSSYKIASSGTDNLSWEFKQAKYNYIWGCLNPAAPVIPMLDFDGVDDYISTGSFIDGMDEVTIMAWVKSDSGNASDMVIAGEDSGCKIWLENGNKPTFTITTDDNDEISVGASPINFDEWHHITGTYTNSTGTITLYVDGELLDTANFEENDESIQNTNYSLGTFEVGRLSSNVSNQQYFKGDIDEIRVFNKALTNSQIQQIVYQELDNNNGIVRGALVQKNISDFETGANLMWENLKLYYKMGREFTSDNRVIDYSGNENIAAIHNITSWQEENAPMPLETINDGSWTSENIWLHGDVWNTDGLNDKNYGIIHIKNNITINESIKTMALLIDSGKTLTIAGDNQIENSWYLELNGTIDLMNDSQLIQTVNSDLVTSSEGKVLRRQEGTSSAYWYNYWSSPVGVTAATSLTDNNAATHNANNTDFNLGMLKDDSGLNTQFTNNYTANGNISTYWLYTFINGTSYWDWAQIKPSTQLKSGIGYTQKGTGTAALAQQYIFEGKPNNGTILIDVKDVGGPGSVANISKTECLLGNPYPSALDIHQFIDDNEGVIDGYLQLWQQWGGSSHNLSEYEGGYAQVNKTGSIRAYQFVGIYGDNTGSQDGCIVPTRFLPVGQGFIAEVVADGQVEFNNSQRVFIKESDADGTYDNGSAFSKTGKGKGAKTEIASKTPEEEEPMQRMRLEFNSVTGPETRHELLLGFSSQTTDAFDYGYDAINTEFRNNDLNLDLEGKNMNIQAYGPITADKVVPLNFTSSGDNSFEIRITDTENLDESQEIYLRDNKTGTYFDLTQDAAYSFSSTQGIFNNRFEIVFQSEQQSLSIEESMVSENYIYYQNTTNTLFVKKLNSTVSKLSLVNMRGQIVLELLNVSTDQLQNGLQFNNITTGAYVVCMRTETNEVLTKKIIVN